MSSYTSSRRDASTKPGSGSGNGSGAGVGIAASLLGADHSRLHEAAMQALGAGVDYLHVDVMDGVFVPNLAFGPGVVEALRDVGLPVIAHLMVTAPHRHVEAFVRSGADVVTVHAEACSEARELLAGIRRLGARAGLALNPATPLEVAMPLLQDLDLLLIMTVNPGYGGQSFMREVLPKISAASDALRAANPAAMLEVDGGIGPETGALAAAAGATVLAAGSSVFGRGDVSAAVAALRQAAALASGQYTQSEL